MSKSILKPHEHFETRACFCLKHWCEINTFFATFENTPSIFRSSSTFCSGPRGLNSFGSTAAHMYELSGLLELLFLARRDQRSLMKMIHITRQSNGNKLRSSSARLRASGPRRVNQTYVTSRAQQAICGALPGEQGILMRLHHVKGTRLCRCLTHPILHGKITPGKLTTF